MKDNLPDSVTIKEAGPPKSGHNKPPKLIEVDGEMRRFIIENCEANMRMAINIIMTHSRPDEADRKDNHRRMLENVVYNNEMFKKLKAMVE